MTDGAGDDVRFSIPLYTQSEAARYLDTPSSTFRTWAQGYERRTPGRRPRRAAPLVTHLRPTHPAAPSVPFVGLAEGMFLSALRKAGVPMQQIRPALDLVRDRLGVAHALASKQLYAVGAQLLWEVAEEGDLDGDVRRAVIVLRDGQYVFREVVDRHMKRLEYADDGYADRVELPGYEVARVLADPRLNFGHPFFASTGATVQAVLSRLRAGEPVSEVADDFGLRTDEVAEVADRADLVAA